MVSARLKLLFLLLVLAQAAHSTEEYFGRLWEVFAPAQVLTSLVYPPDPLIGFLIVNIGLVLFGFLGYFAIVRPERRGAIFWIQGGIILEATNGLGHVTWAVMNGGYRPGVGTALLFLILVPLLMYEVPNARVRPS